MSLAACMKEAVGVWYIWEGLGCDGTALQMAMNSCKLVWIAFPYVQGAFGFG